VNACRWRSSDLTLAALVDDCIDPADDAGADEDGSFVVYPQRTRVGDATCVNFDVETLRQFQVSERQLVGVGGNWRRRNRRNLGDRFVIRPTLRPGWRGGHGRCGGRRLLLSGGRGRPCGKAGQEA